MKIVQVISSSLPIKPTGERQYGAVELIMEEYRKKLIDLGHTVEFKWLNDVVEGEQDIVHIHVANLCVEAKRKGISYIYSNHDHHSFYYGKDSGVFKEQLEAIKGSVFSITHAESVINYFSETDKLFYLPHGVDTDFYTHTGIVPTYSLIHFNFIAPRLLMVAANGMAGDYGIDRKGFRLGIEAAKKLNMPITIVGNEANIEFFKIHKDLAAYYNLTVDASNCTEQQKIKYYQTHSIFLHPSSLEFGSPNITLLESWSCRLPSIAAYDGLIKIDGMQVLKALDVDEICERINYIHDNYAKIYFEMKEADRMKHDWSTVVAQLDKMYRLFAIINNEDTSEIVKNKYIATYA